MDFTRGEQAKCRVLGKADSNFDLIIKGLCVVQATFEIINRLSQHVMDYLKVFLQDLAL